MEKIVTAIMMFFMVLGALDRAVFRNRFGLGNEFVKGLNSIGPLILGMAGIMCSAPVLGKLLLKLVTPLFGAIGADPAIIAGTCFGLDMGGYYMTASMTNDPSVIMLGGVILSTVLGATIVFTIPVALTLCRPEDASAVSKGIVFGIISCFRSHTALHSDQRSSRLRPCCSSGCRNDLLSAEDPDHLPGVRKPPAGIHHPGSRSRGCGIDTRDHGDPRYGSPGGTA